MSLDVTLVATKMTTVSVFDANITHNLTAMAREAGLYEPLWRPEEIGAVVAGDLVELLASGLANLRRNPEKFMEMNPSNGWGSYDDLVDFTKGYLLACIENPDATIEISR